MNVYAFSRFTAPLAFCSLALSGCNNPDVSVAEYQKIQKGMSLQEVEKIVGSSPDKIEDLKSLNKKICYWQDSDKAVLLIIFDNDKAQEFERVDGTGMKTTPHQ